MPFKEKPKIHLEDFADMIGFDSKGPSNEGSVVEMKFSEMVSFPNHKFKLYEGTRLDDMVQRIKNFGILLPIILWHKDDAYIILSGHNRKNAGQLAGLKKAPVIIKDNLTMSEAMLIVTETNLRQRSFADLSHAERACCLSEHYNAMKSQGKRNDMLQEIEILLQTEEGTLSEMQTRCRTDEILGRDYGMSRDKVAKYIRIATISKLLMDLLDNGDIPFAAAYTLSFIENHDMQDSIANMVKSEHYKLDMKKATLLRTCYADETLTKQRIAQILKGEKVELAKPTTTVVKLHHTVIQKYFSADKTSVEIEQTIEKALEAYFHDN